MFTPPATLRMGEAARALGISTDTLRRWADHGRIRVWRLPSGERRFYAEDVQEILARPEGKERSA